MSITPENSIRQLVLATGKIDTIKAYAQMNGRPVHSLSPDNFAEEPDHIYPLPPAYHKADTLRQHTDEARERLGIEATLPMDYLAMDVSTTIALETENGVIFEPLLKAERHYDINNPDHNAALREQAHTLYDQPFYVFWQIAFACVSNDNKVNNATSMTYVGFFSQGIPAEITDAQFDNKLEQAYVIGPRLNLADLARDLDGVEIKAWNEETGELNDVDKETVYQRVVNRLLPQALLGMLLDENADGDMKQIEEYEVRYIPLTNDQLVAR